MDELIFPIGKYAPQSYSEQLHKEWVAEIESLPSWLDHLVVNLDEAQLSMPYREGGWSTKQIIHHLADSHMNAYIRCKLALTEDKPVIKPYNQDDWAALSDNDSVPVNVSITMLHALHRRWMALIKTLSPSELERSVMHPEYNREMTIWFILGLYAWHGKHHATQISRLRERMSW